MSPNLLAYPSQLLIVEVLRRPLESAQYTSSAYQQALTDAGIRASMGQVGTCWDNALAESFWAVLKNELIYTRSWPTRRSARTAIFDYIETFYNTTRRHSALDFISPNQYEGCTATRQAA